jgi:cytochrome b561
MAGKAEITGYNTLQIGLHWLVVILIAMEYATSGFVEDGASSGLAVLHVWPGIAIIVAMTARLLIRLVMGAPEPPKDEHPMLRRAAVWTHWAFYVLLIAIPAGGLADHYYQIGSGMLLHNIAEGIFFILMWLHIAAALAHHFVLRTDVLRRMLKPAR